MSKILGDREKDLLFEVIEMLRDKYSVEFSDWKDCDDYLFSKLDITKDELKQIYAKRNVLYYNYSCKD